MNQLFDALNHLFERLIHIINVNKFSYFLPLVWKNTSQMNGTENVSTYQKEQ